jgi:hypothetical protein
MVSLDDFIDGADQKLPASIEDLLSEPDHNKKTPTFFSGLKNNVYSHLKNYVKSIKEYKFSFSFASVTVLTDRLLTYLGIKNLGFYEENRFSSFLMSKIGLVSEMGITYLGFMLGGYFLAKYLAKKSGITNKESGRSLYSGIGAAEGIISLHNYFLYAGMYNFLSLMAFPPLFGLTCAVAAAPYMFYFARNYLKQRRAKKEKYKESAELENKDGFNH